MEDQQLNGHQPMKDPLTSDLVALLNKFESKLSISPLKQRPITAKTTTTANTTRTIIPSLSSSAVIRLKCLQFIQSTIGKAGKGIVYKDDDEVVMVALMLKCFAILNTGDDVDNDVVKLQNEYTLELINSKKYQEALQLIYLLFKQINNLVSKNENHKVDDDNDDEVCIEKLIHGLKFNVFNLKYAKHITNNYILLAKLVLEHGDVLISSQQFLLICNQNCYNWFNSIDDNKPMNIMKKNMINYSNRCKSVLKLNFIIKALLFTQDEDMVLYKHFGTVLDKLIKIDDKLTYQYTAKFFAELLHLKLPVNKIMYKWVSAYAQIKAKYQDEFRNIEDINWLKFLDKQHQQQEQEKENHVDISDVMDQFVLRDGQNMDQLLRQLHEGYDWEVADKDKVRKLIKCNVKCIKLNHSNVLKLLIPSLQILAVVELDSKYLLEFLNYVTGFIKDLKFVTLLNDVIKNLSNLYKKLNRIEKFRNLSNICFQNGGKLLISNFRESLNQWMSCVNYEYNILNNDFNFDNFKFFKLKIDRISNLLIENGKYHESKIFLMKIFQCYIKLQPVNDFLQLENNFNKDLNISLRLLIKSTVLSKSLDLQNLDETLQALITSGILKNLSSLNIDGKTIIINDIMENIKKNMKDRGLFQYLLIKYYNLIGLDSFIHVNYKECNEKEFPHDSQMIQYKELIICFNYLQYTINRTFNQTITIRSIDLFRRWLSMKPNSMLNNNDILFNLEFSFVKNLLNFLQYQHLYIYLIEIAQDFLKVRSPILKNHHLNYINFIMSSVLGEAKFSKIALNKLGTMKPCMDKIRNKLLELQCHLDVKNMDLSKLSFKECWNMLKLDNTSLTNNDKKLKLVQNLIIYSRFSYLSSIYKFQHSDLTGSIIDIRRSIRLAKIILMKYISHLSNVEMNEFNAMKWEISSMLMKSLTLGIQLMIHCGLTKNCVYYVDELLTFLDTQQLPIDKCYGYYAIAEFYLLSRKFMKANEFMIKSDEIYNNLEFEDNLLELEGLTAHSFYFQMIGDLKNEKIYNDKIVSFYKDLQDGKLNLEFTKLIKEDPHGFHALQLEIDYKIHFKIDGDRNLDNQFSKKLHTHHNLQRTNTIRAKNNLIMAKRLLNSDPVLSGLEESVITIPSTMSSTRESTITHKALISLSNSEIIFRSLLTDHWRGLKNFEIYDLNKAFLNVISLKSSITTSSLNLIDFYNKDEIPRYLPFTFDRDLNRHLEDTHQLLPDLEISSLQLHEKDVYHDLQKKLPQNWLVITIDICPHTGNLLFTRFEKESDAPFVIRLPLIRHSTGDTEDGNNNILTFEDAMIELKRIINESNATTKNDRISQIKTRDDKLKWWDERKKLDQDLQKLLQKVELNWIGGFKGIFNQAKVNSNLKLEFKQKFDIILNQYLPSRFNKKSKANNKIDIHDQILEIFFLNLSIPLGNTDLLEDLIYFLMDILLFHGEENSFDEVDIDHMYIDIEELLTKYHNENVLREFGNFDHTVLIVSKECCNFPWESLPYLRNFSISRLPSLKMLKDLLSQHESLEISRCKGSYIINPNNDLINTESNFKDKFQSSLPHWDGLIGVKPSEEEFKKALIESNLLIYIGHGSGDQYIRSSTIKSINQCSPSLLIGCSSGILHENGLLEPYGTVYNHLIAGSPMIMVNLWDVTDKDIDKFTISVFDKWGLFTGKYNKSITQAISSSRDGCNLKFLNGAAPILYGLPFKLKD